MAWYLYKCNTRNHPQQVAMGDWRDVFQRKGPMRWGDNSGGGLKGLNLLMNGDMLLAYQSNRKEIVGVAQACKVKAFQEGDRPRKRVFIRPIEQLNAKLKALGERDPAIPKFGVFKPGPVATVYPLTNHEAAKILRAARALTNVSGQSVDAIARLPMAGGFGSTPVENRKVELAAVKAVTNCFKRDGWAVKDVSKLNLGYDLLCSKRPLERHVEVKGISGTEVGFIVTANEKRAWELDKDFMVATVTSATSSDPKVTLFSGTDRINDFQFSPLSYFVRLNGKTRLK